MDRIDIKRLYEDVRKSPFREISFSEYLELVKQDSSIVETSPERLYRIASNGNLDIFRRGKHRIEGITEVLERLVSGLYVASKSYDAGQIPLLLLIGPTGSGKSEIGKLLENALIEDLAKNPRFTYYLTNGKKKIYCPFKEDPIKLITDPRLFFPPEIKENYMKYKRGYLCSTCFNTLIKFLRSDELANKNTEHSRLGSEDMEEKEILDLLNKKVKVVRLFPQIASIELTHHDFSNLFESIIKNANRGILNIIIDDKTISQIPNTNYQILTRLRDARVSLKDGTEFTPDLVALLYTNAKLEDVTTSPLRDSVYPIFVRRNLSYTAEENIIRKNNLPFEHISPNALSLLARFAVGSRIDVGSIGGISDEDKIKNLETYLEIYEKYERGGPLSEEEFNKIKGRISGVAQSKDGWDKGISSRGFAFDLFNIEAHGGCLTLEDVEMYLEKKREDKELKYSAEASLGRLKNISFRDVVMAYMINISGVEKGVASLEDLFSYYISLYKAKVLDGKTTVNIPGEGQVPIDIEMDRIAKKLSLYKDGREELDRAIDQYFIERKKPPTLSELLLINPHIIYLNPQLLSFVPWKEIKRGVDLNPKDRERVEKLINILKKDLGYCDKCALSVIRIFAKGMVRE